MKTMNPAEVHDEIAKGGNVVLVDVRSEDEYNMERIPGTLHIALDELPERMGELQKFDMVYVHCASGGRSARAGLLLEEHGIDAVNVAGGIFAWKQAGLPVEGGA